MEEGGRIVNVASASGPNFVADCSPPWQRFFQNPAITWTELDDFLRECRDLAPEALAEKGLGTGRAYGLAKACVNSYTLMLAREHPQLTVNACTPGFIETDLTLAMLKGTGRTPEDAGMKSPAEGARVILFLLFGEPAGSGLYYGSDCRRSPLDRYRAPGSAEYTGD